jgi:hypothetical protein
MQPRRFSIPRSSSTADTTPKFNVVVAFDDQETSSTSALRTCDYVISQLGGDIQVRRKVVNFERPTTPRARAAAAKDAARADMVIVSTREQAQLPSEMQAWMDEWSSQRSAEEGALVAIVNRKDKKEARADRSVGVREQLAQMAQQMNMDFFSSEVAT